jgi:two-component system, NtrC family, response regulator AtoC
VTTGKIRILIIDDEELIVWGLTKQLEKEGYELSQALSGDVGYSLFLKESPEIVILDNKMPGLDGIQVLRKIKSHSPDTIVIFMTAYSSIDTAVESMKLGAYDYINKPIEIEELKILLQRALEKNRIEKEVSEHRRELKEKYGFNSIIGATSQIESLLNTIRKISNSEANMVLVQGESGTGKELVARAIHYESKRNDQPFIAINCAALPETLLESELFGYEQGAFTDAKRMKKGQFELSGKGTILLDEIGEISTQMQVKLLRLLESRQVMRLGGTKPIEINSRIIAATNRNLEEALQAGAFRQDLYYRLKVINIEIPPLRERSQDISLLVRYFIDKYNKEFGKSVESVDPAAEKAMMQYGWPGNVRELRNVIERVLLLENEPIIMLNHLPVEIITQSSESKQTQEIEFNLPNAGFPLEEVEKILVKTALERNRWNQSKAANFLSISRDTLRYKMKKHRLLSSRETKESKKD